jgi:hypothetical protein
MQIEMYLRHHLTVAFLTALAIRFVTMKITRAYLKRRKPPFGSGINLSALPGINGEERRGA